MDWGWLNPERTGLETFLEPCTESFWRCFFRRLSRARGEAKSGIFYVFAEVIKILFSVAWAGDGSAVSQTIKKLINFSRISHSNLDRGGAQVAAEVKWVELWTVKVGLWPVTRTPPGTQTGPATKTSIKPYHDSMCWPQRAHISHPHRR